MLRPKRSIYAEVNKHFADETLPLYLCFSADWCDSCSDQKPVIEKLEPEFQNKVRFVRIDIDENPDFQMAAGVKAIPAHVVVNSEKNQAGISIGYLDEDELESFVSKALTL